MIMVMTYEQKLEINKNKKEFGEATHQGSTFVFVIIVVVVPSSKTKFPTEWALTVVHRWIVKSFVDCNDPTKKKYIRINDKQAK